MPHPLCCDAARMQHCGTFILGRELIAMTMHSSEKSGGPPCVFLNCIIPIFISAGSAVRDKALEILLRALTPDEALSREEAAKKLEAALYASCTNGKATGQSGQPAEPGVTYMRRLRVLWSWLDGSSPHRSPGLKRLFIEGVFLHMQLILGTRIDDCHSDCVTTNCTIDSH